MGTDIDGGNAAYLLAPVSTLVELPSELSFAEGAAKPAAGTAARDWKKDLLFMVKLW